MMRVVIIEDEQLTAEDLAGAIREYSADIQISKILGSVSEAVKYFREAEQPDLIFCDIQLGDGHSFEIFSSASVSAPVIFCTAYHEYALEAFKSNGIDYILKPFNRQTIRSSIEKFHTLRGQPGIHSLNYETILQQMQMLMPLRKNNTLLVHWKDRIIPVKISEVAYFYIELRMVYLATFNNQTYYINNTLDELEQICGPFFFRANRQYLVNRESVKEVRQYHTRKLAVQVQPGARHDILISKFNITPFLEWLKQ